ncbi:NADP-dependent oxidoreductase domain-containing protein [Elsinoe ampelina]|uniref:NADP-dependent oxidoreductase domain-containing protein n=1 Tax=Elsinoe ampelina TaxID=302913 RepID=A0A6A6G806_9PEZI|nr:NADP-dependent oxidoreductase domain-containing protein [Elsinoe ampelina]
MSAPAGTPKMEYRHLGRSGLKVSAISLGGWLTYGGHVENEETFACMKAAYDCGINFFDCAEGYAGGESEKIMGAAIKHYGWKRNDLVISTKIYWGGANGDNPVNNGGLSRKHLVEGTKAALERLGLEYVDLLYAHRPDRDTPMEETVRAFNHLIDQGKALYWGTSDWQADEIERAWAVAERLNLIGPLMEQPKYNLLTRGKVEGEYRLLIENRGLGLTIFSPLEAGILTGKYNDSIPDDSRLGKSDDNYIKSLKEKFGTDDWQEQIKLVKALLPITEKLSTNLATLSMAWVLANKHVSSAITGASRPQQIYDSVKALELVPKLTPEILAEIDGILKNKPQDLTRRFF